MELSISRNRHCRKTRGFENVGILEKSLKQGLQPKKMMKTWKVQKCFAKVGKLCSVAVLAKFQKRLGVLGKSV